MTGISSGRSRDGNVTDNRKPRILSGAYDSQARYRDIRFMWQVHKRVHSYRSKCSGPPGLVEPHGHCTSYNSMPRTQTQTHTCTHLRSRTCAHNQTSMSSSLYQLIQEGAYARCFNYRFPLSLSPRHKWLQLPCEISFCIDAQVRRPDTSILYALLFTGGVYSWRLLAYSNACVLRNKINYSNVARDIIIICSLKLAEIVFPGTTVPFNLISRTISSSCYPFL